MAASVALTLGSAEIVLRLLGPQQAKRITIYDPDLGWRSEPLGRERFVIESEGVDVEYSFNSLGFRGPEWEPPDLAARRVVLLGDSMLEALEVDLSATAPALLTAKLGAGWQVTTIACRGWSTGQQLLAFRKYGLERRPERVVLAFFTGNDFSDNLRQPLYALRDGRLVHRDGYRTPWMAAYQRTARWAYVNLALAFYAKHGLEQIAALATGRGGNLPLEAVPSPDDQELTRLLLLQLDHEVRAAGATLLVAILPTRWELDAGDQRAGDLAASWLEQSSISCLPLHRRMSREMFFSSDPHLSPAGHRFVGEAMAAALRTGLGRPSGLESAP